MFSGVNDHSEFSGFHFNFLIFVSFGANVGESRDLSDRYEYGVLIFEMSMFEYI